MNITKILLIILVSVIFGFMAIGGVGGAIENQDTMLCESAKISGNREYLKKCECYYQSGDIKCLQN